MTEKYLQKCSLVIAISKIQIKTTLNFNVMPVRMPKIFI